MFSNAGHRFIKEVIIRQVKLGDIMCPASLIGFYFTVCIKLLLNHPGLTWFGHTVTANQQHCTPLIILEMKLRLH